MKYIIQAMWQREWKLGAVMGAAPRKNVVRDKLLIQGILLSNWWKNRKRRLGGATGSSKAHTTESIETLWSRSSKG